MSRLGVQPAMNSSYVSEMRQQASQAERASQSELEAAAAIRTATHTDRSSVGRSTNVSSGFESGNGGQSGTSLESFDRKSGSTSTGTEERSSTGQSLRSSDGHNRGAETVNQVSGSIDAGMPLGGRGAGRQEGGGSSGAAGRILNALPIPKISGGVTKSGIQRDGLSHSSERSKTDDFNSSQTAGSRDEHSNGDSAGTSSSTYNRSGTFTRASSDSTSSVGQEDALSQAYSHEQRAQKLHELSQSLTRDANFAESHSLQMSENLSQELAQWYAGEAATKPGLNAPGLHQTTFTDQERRTRDAMISQFLSQRRQAIYDEVAPSLHQPDLVHVAAPPVATDADVTARYHPHGLSALPSAPAMPDGSAASERVSSGKDTLTAEQGAQGVMRAGAVQAGSQVQSGVNKDLNRQFFTDPSLRK
ncbi:MAG: hypothetical protein EOO77_12995 [Oxalobacteraceae bacterium]|nr:MAG: hypothetical protein EOO77_12995 [Oxalobacteraceae bacterium]